jgi:hypothetical protein
LFTEFALRFEKISKLVVEVFRAKEGNTEMIFVFTLLVKSLIGYFNALL